MKKLTEEIIYLLERQGFVIVSTLDKSNCIHCSAKGVVKIEPEGKVFVFDLYHRQTYQNLQKNPIVSITAVDAKHFRGYTLKGKGKIVPRGEVEAHFLEKWEKKILQRMTQRVIEGVQSQSKSQGHFEAQLPEIPKYLIEIDVDDIVDLAPPAMQPKDG